MVSDASLVLGNLYWVLETGFAVDPETSKFRFNATKFSVIHTEHDESGKPLFLGKDGSSTILLCLKLWKKLIPSFV